MLMSGLVVIMQTLEISHVKISGVVARLKPQVDCKTGKKLGEVVTCVRCHAASS